MRRRPIFGWWFSTPICCLPGPLRSGDWKGCWRSVRIRCCHGTRITPERTLPGGFSSRAASARASITPAVVCYCRQRICRRGNHPSPPDPPCGSSLTQDQEPRQDYLLDYAAPFAEPGHATNLPVVHKPPVWVTILGRDDWWPVAVVTPKPGSKLASTLLNGPQPAAPPNEKFTIENSPRLWCIFFWLIAVACAAHVAGVFLMNFWYWNSPWKGFRL